MNKSPIEWTDFTSNPIRAFLPINAPKTPVGHYCEKISPGCKNCYASRLQPRFGMPTFDEAKGAAGKGVEPHLDQSALQKLLTRRKPCKVFLGDMTDIFGEWVPDEWLDQIFAVMAITPHITYQVLTKRAERMREYFSLEDRVGIIDICAFENYVRPAAPGRFSLPEEWPLPNLWLGVSAENQEYADLRIPHLLQTPAAVRFVSYEPALGPVDFNHLHHDNTVEIDCLNGTHGVLRPHGGSNDAIDWVIVGGESGPKARPMHPDWARSVRDQCNAARVPFFFKQWGAWTPGENVDGEAKYETVTVDVDTGEFHKCADDWVTEADNGPIMYRVGKKAAGHLLDGKEWRQFPEVTS